LTPSYSQRELRILLILLGILGILLVVTTIRGAFIIDEINYMVNVIGLREGRLTVPGTEGLSPSKELLYFDPEPFDRVVHSTPVSSIAPSLYAPLALPFVFFGWRGLAFLNTLSFVLSALFVFLIVGRNTTESSSAWLAVGLFVLGGYSAEYAQGVWPQMLSVFLCVIAVYVASLVWSGEKSVYAMLGGLFIGLASGVREQNIFLAGCLGLTILLWGNRRIYSAGLFLAGIAAPLLASATLNYFSLGIFYPTPKASSYAEFVTNPVRLGSWMKPFEVFWVKIVDFSAFAWFQDPAQFVDYAKEPSTGAFLAGGMVKKALIQSSPWIALALALCVAIWIHTQKMPENRKTIVRALSILILPVFGMFSMAGFRMDGLSFNQRYLLEIVPLAAIVVALSLDGSAISAIKLIYGFLFGGLSFAVLLIFASSQLQHLAVLKVPLLLGFILVLTWILRRAPSMRQIFGVVLGLCIGWSFMTQTIDLAASRRIRTINAVGLDSLDARIPDHSALFAFWGSQKSTAGPMQLSKDVVILDTWSDMGKDAPLLTRELLQQQRRIFVFGSGMPPATVQDIQGKDSLALVLTRPFPLYELVERHERSDSSSGPTMDLLGSTSHSKNR
jgi:hypothetical protein